jgi:hypothetical protein
VAYSIGQFRYGESSCVESLTGLVGYKSVSLGEESTSTSFQDIVLTPSENFVRGNDYYLSISIPQDMNYEMSFNIKLIKSNDSSSSDYQFLKNVSIVRGGTGENVHDVALYEKKYTYTDQEVVVDGEVTTERVYDIGAMIPLEYNPSDESITDYIYHDSTNDVFYVGNPSGGYDVTTDYNNVSIIASWKQEESDSYGVFEIVFRPVDDSFASVLFEMVRGVEDYNIQRMENGVQEYGRKVDAEKVKFSLYKINNLVNTINPGNELSHIGVWGHPGLLMAINGEEIKVGPSGYYELDYEISSFGVVAQSFQDNFSLDYQYITSEE